MIDTAGRATIEAVVTRIVNEEAGWLLGVKPVQGNLTLSVGPSRYQRALELKGYTVEPGCAVDCTVLSGSAVDPAYCTTGITADVILSITKPAGLVGIAGTGSSCANDQVGIQTSATSTHTLNPPQRMSPLPASPTHPSRPNRPHPSPTPA